ncbi:hypothetical protein B0H12DRAFT_189483 [Mycena haematopus]|nr:hypothetical protein B0H12DRAFT_189483 [Mycena haematopus]
MPMLRSLILVVFACDVFAFYEAPQLRTVVLQGRVGPLGSKITFNLPWIQLTCLTLRCVGVSQSFRILAQTLNLVQCTLVVDENDAILDDLARSDLTLECLESLVLEINAFSSPSTSTVSPGGFLHPFIVPSLRRLELEGVFLGAEPISVLESFISRSGCRLQEVWILGRIYNDSYLQAFPSIPTFSFTDCEGTTIRRTRANQSSNKSLTST